MQLSMGGADLKFLYTTPESLRTQALQSALSALYTRGQLALFAIDEVPSRLPWAPAPLTLSAGALHLVLGP